MDFRNYQTDGFYDELFEGPGRPRPGAVPLIEKIKSLGEGELIHKQRAAEAALHQMGITFTVYGDQASTEKIFPFDIIPRIVEADDWQVVERGLVQRVQALNLFVDDVYHDQRIIKDGVVPGSLINTATSFRPQCVGLDPPRGVWTHVTGSDLIRDSDGGFYVLEDNLRCPSGVSYVLMNRQVLKCTFPRVFGTMRVRPIQAYAHRLLDTLAYLVPDTVDAPNEVVLTPGSCNSAYFEHTFLAGQMGVQLVEGRDLVVIDGFVMMRTTQGFERVDVIYRRIDDDFLDPQTFRADSLLGVPGLMDVYRSGRVALANAPGTGIADDKAVYAYVPAIIRYYLKQEPILPNVQTYVCSDAKQREHVLANLDKMVVKAVNLSGGYGMLMGPDSTRAQREEFADRVRANPRNYIAQPVVRLSRSSTIVEDRIEGRHVDLRPFVLYGQEVHVMPGGLTRVALSKGSLIVNSSQGGGSKDTWVLS